MIARSVNAAAGVVQAAMEQGRQTATGIALAMDSAGLLMSPEMAAEIERLRSQVVELQETASEAGRDAARARRERDLMRERVSEPFGCAHCGAAKRSHGRRYLASVGTHAWERPSDEQVKARMLARRVARMPLDMAPQPSAEDRRNLYAKALYEFVNGAFVWEASDDQDSWLTEAAAAIVVADAEQAKLRTRVADLEAERHTTNEALDDAVQALRADRDEPAAPYVSRLLPPRDAVCARPGCGHRGEDHHHGDTKCWAHLPRVRQADLTWSPVTICGCAGFVAGLSAERPVNQLTATFAPVAALREDPHDSPLYHPYAKSRDLPETGGAQ